ncbi:Transcription factor TGA like domain - like 2 [Theobroma cacao]|nr:Transcription factor TGA like domain - like 2 [Theobroma cacao]
MQRQALAVSTATAVYRFCLPLDRPHGKGLLRLDSKPWKEPQGWTAKKPLTALKFLHHPPHTSSSATMPRPFSFFSRKKTTTVPFKDLYEDWFNTLTNTLLPLLRQSLSSPSPTLLPFRRDLLLQHFLSHYDFLDLAASNDVSQMLFPSWRNSLEIPFLFLGDLHPYLFTNLLRSFIDAANNEKDAEKNGFNYPAEGSLLETFEYSLDKPWPVLMAWTNPSENLMLRIEQIECGLRLMVPPLVSRVKKVQAAFVGRVAEKWAAYEGKKMALEEAVKVEMEEMLGVFVDANRLRRSVLIEIVNATDVYQGALFLEGLAQFLIGFKDRALLGEFERCKIPINGVHWGL